MPTLPPACNMSGRHASVFGWRVLGWPRSTSSSLTCSTASQSCRPVTVSQAHAQCRREAEYSLQDPDIAITVQQDLGAYHALLSDCSVALQPAQSVPTRSSWTKIISEIGTTAPVVDAAAICSSAKFRDLELQRRPRQDRWPKMVA